MTAGLMAAANYHPSSLSLLISSIRMATGRVRLERQVIIDVNEEISAGYVY